MEAGSTHEKERSRDVGSYCPQEQPSNNGGQKLVDKYSSFFLSFSGKQFHEVLCSIIKKFQWKGSPIAIEIHC